MRVEFTVAGIPPKKDGASSMWGKPSVIPLIKALRIGALAARGDRPAFDEPVHLRLVVRSPGRSGRDARARRADSDLDNFVTGVCDALQAVHGGVFNVELWSDVPAAARPDQPVLLTDDSWVDAITAEYGDGDLAYTVSIEPLAES